jgi:hypothetical protein
MTTIAELGAFLAREAEAATATQSTPEMTTSSQPQAIPLTVPAPVQAPIGVHADGTSNGAGAVQRGT